MVNGQYIQNQAEIDQEHTTYKDALKQLQAIEASKARNEDAFPGGLADKYSLDDLAKKIEMIRLKKHQDSVEEYLLRTEIEKLKNTKQ